LDLSGNSFTGHVPSGLANVKELKLGRVSSTGEIDLGGNSGLCNEVIPGLPPCPPGLVVPGLNNSQPPLPQLSPGVLAPPSPRASVWGSAVLPVQEPAPAPKLATLPPPAPAPAPVPASSTPIVTPATPLAPATNVAANSPSVVNTSAASSTPGGAPSTGAAAGRGGFRSFNTAGLLLLCILYFYLVLA